MAKRKGAGCYVILWTIFGLSVGGVGLGMYGRVLWQGRSLQSEFARDPTFNVIGGAVGGIAGLILGIATATKALSEK